MKENNKEKFKSLITITSDWKEKAKKRLSEEKKYTIIDLENAFDFGKNESWEVMHGNIVGSKFSFKQFFNKFYNK